MEHMGDYNHCLNCEHIYDFNDRCPECGSENVSDVNPNEIRATFNFQSKEEKERLEKMLKSHDD